MNSNEIKSFAESIKLTDEQREILVGTLLGDGHLETQNKGRTFRLKVEHSISQKDYTDWLYEKFKNLVLTKPQVKEQKINGKLYQKYWFSTVSNGAVRFYAQQFYQNGKKVRQMAVEYKGGKCIKCGYSKCQRALSFHHVNPKEKDFDLSSKGLTRSWERIKKEIDKCVLLCANCHMEVHDGITQLPIKR